MNTEAIWHEFNDSLRGFLAQRVNDSAQVDDLLQDVYLKIHSSIDNLKDEKRLRSWLFQITRNTLIDYYRARDSHEMLEEFPDFDSETPSDAEEKLANGIAGMIYQLPEKYRDALYATEIKGMSQVELAKQLGISVSGAKSRVQRGRVLLRDALMKCCHFEFDQRGTVIDYHPIECCCCEQEN